MSKSLPPALDRDKVAEDLYNTACKERQQAGGGKGALPPWTEVRMDLEQVESWLLAADRAISLLVSPEELAVLRAEAALPAHLP